MCPLHPMVEVVQTRWRGAHATCSTCRHEATCLPSRARVLCVAAGHERALVPASTTPNRRSFIPVPATHAAARVAMPLPAGHDDCVGCGCVPGSWAVVALARVRLWVFARGGAWVPSYVASKEVYRHRGLTTLLLWVHVCVAVRVSVCVCVTSEQSATKPRQRWTPRVKLPLSTYQ